MIIMRRTRLVKNCAFHIQVFTYDWPDLAIPLCPTGGSWQRHHLPHDDSSYDNFCQIIKWQIWMTGNSFLLTLDLVDEVGPISILHPVIFLTLRGRNPKT